MIICTLDDQYVCLLTDSRFCAIEWSNMLGRLWASLFSSEQGNIIDLLLTNSFGINNIEAIEINIPIHIMVRIDLIEYLPGNIIIDLLFHLLELLESYLFFIFLIATLLIFTINFGLKTLPDFFVLFYYSHSFIHHELFDVHGARFAGRHPLQILFVSKLCLS